jgi:hypothetical protein
MSPNRQTLCIICLSALLVAGYAIFARVAPWRAKLAETNFQANLIRLQAFLFDPQPRAVLVGSSISGRLLPDYFDKTQLAPMANLGLDGSSALFGLDLTLTRPPQVVIVEVNTLLKQPDANDQLLAATIHSPSFRLSGYLPILRAQSRPSSMLYSWLKLRRNNPAAISPDVPPAAPPTSAFSLQPSALPHSAPTIPSPSSEASYAATRDRLRAQIQALRTRGCHIVLVRLPAGHQSASDNQATHDFCDNLAQEFNLRQLDLGAELSSRGRPISYTDGMHLTPSSAREASRLLAELLAND